jgi:hypothetical protein
LAIPAGGRDYLVNERLGDLRESAKVHVVLQVSEFDKQSDWIRGRTRHKVPVVLAIAPRSPATFNSSLLSMSADSYRKAA